MTNVLSVPQAVAAALAVAAAHGVECDEPEVLKNGANVIVHLVPSPVVGRVAATTAVVRPRPEDYLARDVAVASYAHRNGASVVPPSDELPAGPHLHDGRVLTFWRYVEHDRGREADPSELGASLAALHEVLAGYDLHADMPLPYLGPALGELPGLLDALGARGVLNRSEIARFEERRARCAVALPLDGASEPSEQALHGDSHRRNVLTTAAGLVWTDFEDACRGSVAWDLACARRSGPDVLTAYGHRPSDAEVAPYLEARELQSELWAIVFAARDRGALDERAL
ncbi:MAG: hypothetical protein JWL83_3033 [Actinomycetia bacterium]|nr:hypothetical protein [Actinomycetes bacterium]